MCPRLSLIIPTRNEAETVCECIDATAAIANLNLRSEGMGFASEMLIEAACWQS